LAQQRAKLEPVAALLQQLQGGDEDAAEAALEKLLDSGKLDKVAEKRLRRIYEREKSMEGLSERERSLSEQLERERGEKTRLAQEREAQEKQRAAAQEAQQVEAIQAHIGGAIEKSLEMMQLPPKLEALAVNFMKPIIRASLQAGMPLDPQVLAERVGPLFDEMLSYKARNLDGEQLLKFLGDDAGRKVRQALLARLPGQKAGAPKETKPAESAAGPKWDPRRIL
jgi:hypothetical protein